MTIQKIRRLILIVPMALALAACEYTATEYLALSPANQSAAVHGPMTTKKDCPSWWTGWRCRRISTGCT